MYRMTGLNLLCKVGVPQIPIKPSLVLHFQRSCVTGLLLDCISMGHCTFKSTRKDEQTVQKLSGDIPRITLTLPSSLPTQSKSNKDISNRLSQPLLDPISPTCEVKCSNENTVCEDKEINFHFKFEVKVNGNSTEGIVSQPSDQSLAMIKLCN